MPGLSVRRTIVKSQPEVWSEVSDISSLTRHLGAFGEITISRITPETAVAWEGDRVRGTVTLERSGWGTKVTVTAEAVEVVAATEAVADVTEESAPEPAPTPSESVPTPITPEDDGQSVSTPIPRVRWWQRLFARRLPVAEVPGTPDPVPPAPAPDPEPVPQTDPAPPTPPAPEIPPPPPPMPEPPAEPDPVPAPVFESEAEAEAVITAMLDHIGQAHHRPFSRG